ncbi:MAG: heat-inducible transcriptional repressor HrcA [Clostridia bacterium]
MNKRTAAILRAIIDEYVKTAEPVGSRSIMSNYDFGISSATIRNEMAELEQEGYISQPHTSAGRIPSEKGYRFYVDRILSETGQVRYLDNIIQKMMILMEVDRAIERISQILSNHTDYASLGFMRQEKSCTVQSIHILSLNENEYVLVVILDSKKVAHRIIRVDRDDEIRVDLIAAYINENIANKTVGQIEKMEFGLADLFDRKNKEFIKTVIHEIIGTIRENDGYTYCVKGHEKLLAYPEFSHAADAREVFEALNKKEELYGIISSSDGGKLKISIGSENPMAQLAKISIASRTIDLGDSGHVTLGIAGPVRMNYRKVILSFADIGKMLDSLLKEM